MQTQITKADPARMKKGSAELRAELVLEMERGADPKAETVQDSFETWNTSAKN